jgi:hypothetical protein
MGEAYNVFISWSKDQGKAAATALHEWLPDVIQAAKPWMSDKDIDKGTVWLDELIGALASLRLGIVCLTPESVSEPWLLYEAGVISRTLDRNTRVWTYLLGGLKKEDIPQPLGLFQATVADEVDTFKLLVSVNEALGEHGIPQEAVKRQFGKWWPELKEKLSKLPAPKGAVVPKRKPEEMFAELLEFSREGANVRAQIAALASEMNLVGSAVEEIADAVGQLLPDTQMSIGTPLYTRRIFGKLGSRRFWGTAGPLGATAPSGAPQAVVSNAVLAAGSADSTQGAAGPIKSNGDKGDDGDKK